MISVILLVTLLLAILAVLVYFRNINIKDTNSKGDEALERLKKTVANAKEKEKDTL